MRGFWLKINQVYKYGYFRCVFFFHVVFAKKPDVVSIVSEFVVEY